MGEDKSDDDADRDLREKLDSIADPLEKIQAIADDAAARHAPNKEAVDKQEDKTDNAAERAERLASSGVKNAIPPEDYDRLVRATSADLFPTYALKITREWWRVFNKRDSARAKHFLVLYGPTGRGKTVAGAYVIGQMGGLYIEASELREVMSGGHWTSKRRDLVLASRFTMVDDLGTEKNDEDAQSALFSFVNRRQGLRRGLTLITANLALRVSENGREVREKGLLTRYDERIIARLDHGGRFVEAVGEDLREKRVSRVAPQTSDRSAQAHRVAP